ncbi:MAG: hypothetical protein ACI4JZ_10435 [Oscillospiraceae bacterium]
MKFSERMAAVEAVLFASGEPIELEKIAGACEKNEAISLIRRLDILRGAGAVEGGENCHFGGRRERFTAGTNRSENR